MKKKGLVHQFVETETDQAKAWPEGCQGHDVLGRIMNLDMAAVY